MIFSYIFNEIKYTSDPFLPAISIPAGVDAKGYPLGLQIIGKAFDEQNILNIAYAMEEKIAFKNKLTDWWIK